jgi:hypothetical protein
MVGGDVGNAHRIFDDHSDLRRRLGEQPPQIRKIGLTLINAKYRPPTKSLSFRDDLRSGRTRSFPGRHFP